MRPREEEDYPSEMRNPAVAEEMAHNAAEFHVPDAFMPQAGESRDEAKARVLKGLYTSDVDPNYGGQMTGRFETASPPLGRCRHGQEEAHLLFRQIQDGVNLNVDIRWEVKEALFYCHYAAPRCTWGEKP